MLLAQDPNAPEWIEAWATVAGLMAAVGAGVFAALAWLATTRSLETARKALQIESDRRTEYRSKREGVVS